MCCSSCAGGTGAYVQGGRRTGDAGSLTTMRCCGRSQRCGYAPVQHPCGRPMQQSFAPGHVRHSAAGGRPSGRTIGCAEGSGEHRCPAKHSPNTGLLYLNSSVMEGVVAAHSPDALECARLLPPWHPDDVEVHRHNSGAWVTGNDEVYSPGRLPVNMTVCKASACKCGGVAMSEYLELVAQTRTRFNVTYPLRRS